MGDMGKGDFWGICIAYVLTPLVKKDVVVLGDGAPNIKRALSSLVCYLSRKSERKKAKSLKTPPSRDSPQESKHRTRCFAVHRRPPIAMLPYV